MNIQKASDLIKKFTELEPETQYEIMFTILVDSFPEEIDFKAMANSLNISEGCFSLLYFHNKYFENGNLKIIIAESEENLSNTLNGFELKIVEKIVKMIGLIRENTKITVITNRKARVREIIELLMKKTILDNLP